MDGFVSFSQLNDFLFCPRSLYLHSLYYGYKTSLFHDTAQANGTAAHETIDNNTYKRKGWVSGIWLCSPTYGIYGKCDLYNATTGVLVERKRTVHRLFLGLIMQVWAQAVCLEERGNIVGKIFLHSLTDNIKHSVKLPDAGVKSQLKALVYDIKSYTLLQGDLNPSVYKCQNCIYAPLCPLANLVSKE